MVSDEHDKVDYTFTKTTTLRPSTAEIENQDGLEKSGFTDKSAEFVPPKDRTGHSVDAHSVPLSDTSEIFIVPAETFEEPRG